MTILLKAKWDKQEEQCQIIYFCKNYKDKYVICVKDSSGNTTGYEFEELEYIKFLK